MNDDWLEVETPDDWLSTEPTSVPGPIERATLRAVAVVPDSSAAQLTLLQQCWDRLRPNQQWFIQTLRECRWNGRAAQRHLSSTPHHVSHTTTMRWLQDADYAFVVKILRQDDAGTVLDKDKLLLRQDDIVEQLMTPTQILHQGAATGYFENRAPAASKANEVLMRAAGMLKNDEQTTRHVVRFVNLAGPEVQTAIEVATEIT